MNLLNKELKKKVLLYQDFLSRHFIGPSDFYLYYYIIVLKENITLIKTAEGGRTTSELVPFVNIYKVRIPSLQYITTSSL